VADVQSPKDGTKAADEAKSSTSGIFGFAGSTLFQPGQKLFNPESQVLPYKPGAKSSEPDKAG
jgi:hypothetical protein